MTLQDQDRGPGTTAEPDSSATTPPNITDPPGGDHLGSAVRFFHMAPVGMFRTTVDGRYLMANPKLAELAGYSSPDALMADVTDIGRQLFINPARRTALVAEVQASHGWIRGEQTYRRKDGSIFHGLLSIQAVRDDHGRILYLEGYIEDLTTVRQVEESLEEERSRFRMLVDHSPLGVALIDADGRYRYVNPAFTRMFGYTLEDVPTGRIWFRKAYPDPDARREAIEAWKEEYTLAGPGKVRPHVFSVTRKDGQNRTIHFRSVATEGGQQIITYEDVTDRVQAEAALAVSEARYRSVVEQSPMGIVIWEETSGGVLMANPMFSLMIGVRREELDRFSFWDMVSPSEREELRSALTREKSGSGIPFTRVLTGLRRRPGPFRFEATLSFTRFHDQPAVQAMVRDVTESEQAARWAQHQQKMEAVGTLANGVAHEFNNILMAIRGYSQLLAGLLSDHPQATRLIDKINDNTHRAAGLTEKMLSFSRLEEGERTPLDLNHMLGQVAANLANLLPETIRLDLEPAERLPMVVANRSQIEQVAAGLIMNARDAILKGGTVTVRTRALAIDETFRRSYSWARPGRYVEMEVTDTGEGMTPEVLEHVFEPFFTTKEPGQGTGMGLAVAYSILKSHQGYILAEAAPGGGSTFRLFLPAGEEPGREVEGAIQSDLPRGRGQRVLVVDDEEKVRDYYRKALEILGYQVAQAANGGEALRLFRQAREEGRPFKLALMDFAMPVMDGVQCGERLRELDTQIRLILVTGHAAEFNHEGRKPEFLNALLFKPVDLATLANQVHRALTQPDPTDGAPEVG